MKHLLQAIQLHNAVDSIVQRERERPVIAKELELRRRRAEHDEAHMPLMMENRRKQSEVQNMELREKKATLKAKAIAEGTAGADTLDLAEKYYQGQVGANGLQSSYGALRDGSPQQVEDNLAEVEIEMESQDLNADQRSVILGHLADVQTGQRGSEGQKAIAASKLTPQKLVEGTFEAFDKSDQDEPFQFDESDDELISGIVGRAHEFLKSWADDDKTPLQQKRVMAYSLAVWGAMGSDAEVDEDGNMVPTKIGGKQMFVAKEAAHQYMAGLANADSALMLQYQATLRQSQAEAVIESGEPQQFAQMGEAETYGMVGETWFDVHPDNYTAIHGSLLPTGRQFDEVEYVDKNRGIDLNKAVLDGSIDPQSMLARQIVSKAVIRDWQRRVIQRGGEGWRHAVQGLELAYERVSKNDIPEPGTAIGDVLFDTHQKWLGGARTKVEQGNILNKAQEQDYNHTLTTEGLMTVYRADPSGKLTPHTTVDVGLGVLGDEWAMALTGQTEVPITEFGGSKDFADAQDRHGVMIMRGDIPGGYDPRNQVEIVASLADQVGKAAQAAKDHGNIETRKNTSQGRRALVFSDRFSSLERVLPNVDGYINHLYTMAPGDVTEDSVRFDASDTKDSPFLRTFLSKDVIFADTERKSLQLSIEGRGVTIEPPMLRAIRESSGRNLSRRDKAAIESVLFSGWNSEMEALKASPEGRAALADPTRREAFVQRLTQSAMAAEENARAILQGLSRISGTSNELSAYVGMSDDTLVQERALEAMLDFHRVLDLMGVSAHNESNALGRPGYRTSQLTIGGQ